MRFYWIGLGIVLLLGLGVALGQGLVCADSDGPGGDSLGSHAGSEPPAVPRREDVEAPPPTPRQVARAYAPPDARAHDEGDWSGGDAASGRALFAQHCAVCHGERGTGGGQAAVALNPKPRDFSDGTYYLDADADNVTGEDVDLARVILEGPAAFGGSNAMQGWDAVFDDGEVRDLIAFLRTLER